MPPWIRKHGHLLLGILGIVVMIFGHLFANPEKYPLVLNIFAPAYGRTVRVYEDMLNSADLAGKGSPKVIRPGDVGFVEMLAVLSDDFPEFENNPALVEQIRIRATGLVAGGYFPEKD